MRALILAILFLGTVQATAAEIEIALTDDRVTVDTGFAGARLTLFGAITGVANPASYDIISVIRGPDARFRLRRMEKNNLIWTPGQSHIIENAPGLYLTNATRPISDVATLPAQAVHRLDANYLDIEVDTIRRTATEDRETAMFRDAFISEARSLGLYRSRVGGISFKKGALFTIHARLPANTPVGDYDVTVFLFHNGELIGSDTASLAVHRVELERRIYDFAHQRPVSYGIFCVAMSLFAGWVASLAFRK